MSNLINCFKAVAGALVISGLLLAGTSAQPTSPAEAAASFVGEWMDLWNGRIELAERLIADDFTLHATMLDGSDRAAIDTPQAFAGWVAASRAAFPDLVFTPAVGPMLGSTNGDDMSIAVHWQASGTYAGGILSATVAPGTTIEFAGTDVVRLVDGRVSDYWLVTDTLAMSEALGIGGPAASD